MRLAEQTPGQRSRRHQRRRELDGFERQSLGVVAVVVSIGFDRTGGQQHRAQPVICVAIDQSALHVALEALQRPWPIANRAARVEDGEPGPGWRTRTLGGLFGIKRGGRHVMAALRFDEQPVQAQEPGIVARRHDVECALGRVAIAREL